MRLGISTTAQPLKVLRKLKREGIQDFFELGISSSLRAEVIVEELRGDIQTIHGLPFLKREEKDFMFNPCSEPDEAVKMANRMSDRAEEHGLNYEIYGVHAGLLGTIQTSGMFKVSAKISLEEGLKNLKRFKGLMDADKVALENIYGWDEDSPAIGMTGDELARIGSIMPLLLDLGHAAVNLEHYKGISLEELSLDGLDVREVHVSFVDLHGAPPWDHREYCETKENDRILNKLAEVVVLKPDVPVVLEIKGGFEVIRGNIKLIRRMVEGRP